MLRIQVAHLDRIIIIPYHLNHVAADVSAHGTSVRFGKDILEQLDNFLPDRETGILAISLSDVQCDSHESA